MEKLLGLTWSAVTHVVSVDAETMAATVEEVNSSFYFRDKVTEQNFATLLRHLAIIIINPFFGGGFSNLVTWGRGKFACITMCFDGNTLKSSWKFFNCFL